MEETKNINKIYISEEEIASIDIASVLIKTVEADLQKIISESNDWVKINNKALYYVVSENILIADTRRFQCSYTSYPTNLDGINENGQQMDYYLAKKLFYDNKIINPLLSGDYVVNADRNNKAYVGCWYNAKEQCMSISNNGRSNWNFGDSDTVKIPYLKINFSRVLLTFIKYGLIPEKTKIGGNYKLLSELFQENLIKISGCEIKYDLTDISKNEAYIKIREEYIKTFSTENLCRKLLAVDKTRADIEEYDPTVLTDIGVGHWDLWEMSQENDVEIQLDKTLVARNPLADILYDGIIGIDFGTRSTVVGYQNGSENIHLLRIGKGNLRERATRSDYENPTIIEFDDIESFMKCYSAKEGRPETSWDDVKVSHTANTNFNNNTGKENSENFYSYFYNLKQWCGNVNHNKPEKIRSMKTNKEETLYKYVDLQEGDFDPIEIYAYYLGLYINNMRNKIYMRYIMSFPVTYEKRVREKILASFRKGLKKSLPETVLKNEEAMKHFDVSEGAGEPASYAVCALKEYNCNPLEDSSILYGVFDFGGGTTDYDFGTWRYADEDSVEEERYDYVIEHFGAAGSQYLGGENLLELLAFEVFKANKDILLKERISFTKPVYMDDFDEKEDLVSNTQIANRNTKALAEELRKFLEESISAKDEVIRTAGTAGTNEVNWEEVNKIVKYIKMNNPEAASISDIKDVIIGLKRTGVSAAEITPDDIAAIAEALDISYLESEIYTEAAEPDRFPTSEIVSDYEPINSGIIKVSLFNSEGEMKPVDLVISKEGRVIVDLLEILTSKIEEGVKNFCQAFLQAVSTPEFKDKNITVSNIYIFLAGNSSKSPIVKNIFHKYINEFFPDICRLFRIDFNRNLFLMSPLGSEEADLILKERGKVIDAESLTRPTGKTGVVYGLIESRKGGTILVKNSDAQNDEISFRYFVGVKKRNLFKAKLSKNSEYGEWTRLVNARINEFEIYYSSLPEALSGSLSITDTSVKKKNLRTEQVSDDNEVSIYIRASKPNTIEYCVAAAAEIESGSGIYIQNPVEVNLI